MSNDKIKIISALKEYHSETGIELEKFTAEIGIDKEIIKTLLTEKRINIENETLQKIEQYLTAKRTGEADEAIKKINNFIRESVLTKTQIARKAGWSSATISQYLNNKYPAGTAGESLNNITKAINEIINQTEYKIKNKIENTDLFVKTSVSEEIFGTLKVLQSNVEMGIIQGASGIGKTYSLKRFEKENPSIIYIYVLTGTTLMSLINEIAEKLGIREIKKSEGRRSALLKEVITKLKGTERMLVFDEAQRLSYNCLEMLRDISERAEVTVVIAGQDTLYKNIMGSNSIRYDQLIGRFGIHKRLSGLTETDNEKLINLYFPKIRNNKTRIDLLNTLEKPGKIRVLSKTAKVFDKLTKNKETENCDEQELIEFSLKLMLQREA